MSTSPVTPLPDPLSLALQAVENSQNAKNSALSQQTADQSKLAAIQSALVTDGTTVTDTTTQADSDLNSLIQLAQSMLSNANAGQDGSSSTSNPAPAGS